MKGRDSTGDQLHIVPVAWRDPRAVVLRELMDDEMSGVYGSRFSAPEPADLRPEAVALYERTGYERIEIYEPYVTAVPFSLCFEKQLQPHDPL